MNEFKQGRVAGLWEASLSYHDILTCTEHPVMTVMLVWNQWIEADLKQRRAGTVPCNVTTVRDDRHVVCMAIMDCTASSTMLS